MIRLHFMLIKPLLAMKKHMQLGCRGGILLNNSRKIWHKTSHTLLIQLLNHIGSFYYTTFGLSKPRFSKTCVSTTGVQSDNICLITSYPISYTEETSAGTNLLLEKWNECQNVFQFFLEPGILLKIYLFLNKGVIFTSYWAGGGILLELLEVINITL